MLHRLDPFGDDLDIERFADIDNRLDKAALRQRMNDRGDELPVDLQAARLQLRQADDRGVAGAEIVDLDIDAKLLDLVDGPGEMIVAFVEIDRLDQFERQRA